MPTDPTSGSSGRRKQAAHPHRISRALPRCGGCLLQGGHRSRRQGQRCAGLEAELPSQLLRRRMCSIRTVTTSRLSVTRRSLGGTRRDIGSPESRRPRCSAAEGTPALPPFWYWRPGRRTGRAVQAVRPARRGGQPVAPERADMGEPAERPRADHPGCGTALRCRGGLEDALRAFARLSRPATARRRSSPGPPGRSASASWRRWWSPPPLTAAGEIPVPAGC